jgi:hypothetical protein
MRSESKFIQAEPRRELVHFKTTAQEKCALLSLAAQRGISLSEFIRRQVLSSQPLADARSYMMPAAREGATVVQKAAGR